MKRDAPAPGAVTLEGRVSTYSGMPVNNATVDISVTGASRWRWFVPQVIMVILATLIPKNIISIREIIPYLSKYIGIPIIFVLFPLILILANIKYKHLNKSNSSNIRKEEKNN